MVEQRSPASFRDPSGHIFELDGVLYRHVAPSYRHDFDALIESGLYRSLSAERMVVSHEEVDASSLGGHSDAYRVLMPERIPFVSYPYEWSFSQLQDAALLTLDIQQRALDHGLWLKDASAYNIQFVGGAPIFIDTLSFEKYPEGNPWPAYQQFCRHFLAPLALMALVDVELGKLLRVHIDGIPLPLASKMLPRRSWLGFSLLTHIHLHAKSIRRFQSTDADATPSADTKATTSSVSKTSLLGLVDTLRSAIRRFRWKPAGTEWGEYYGATNYDREAREHKVELVAKFITEAAPTTVWDLGANTGEFSALAARQGIETVALDVDPAAVEKAYLRVRSSGESQLLPLLMDLTNPSAALGWSHAERMSLRDRGPVDLAMALALVHHLAISNNVPLPMVAEFMRGLCQRLIIEFVPKSDSQVRRLLASRPDIFDEYDQEGFEAAFGEHFELLRREPIRGSDRVLYLFG